MKHRGRLALRLTRAYWVRVGASERRSSHQRWKHPVLGTTKPHSLWMRRPHLGAEHLNSFLPLVEEHRARRMDQYLIAAGQ
jgi:hypothetical protein